MSFMRSMRPLSRMFRSEPAARSVSPAPAAKAPPAEDVPARMAAIAALSDGPTLRGMAGLAGNAASKPAAAPGAEPAAVVQAARARLAALIDAEEVQFARLRSEIADTDALLSLAVMCREPARLAALLDERGAPEFARLAAHGSSSRVRQLAAQRVVDPAQLKQLLKEVRGKDKNVYRIVRQKCDQLHAAEQRSASVENDAAAACASLERHSHRVHDAVYEATFDHFSARWQALAGHAPPAVTERALRAGDRCREIIAEHHRAAAQLAERRATQAALEAAQSAAAQTAAAQTATALAEAALADAAPAAPADTAQAHAEPPPGEAEPTTQAAAVDGRVPTTDAQTADAPSAEAQAEAAHAAALRRLGGLVAKTHGALRSGDTARAAGLRRAIEQSLRKLPDPPAHLLRQIQQLDVKLSELRHWKDFAVAPKRTELIADMQALIGASDEPRVLAERVKQLQDEWRSISKGIVIDSQEDWQRFHAAAEAAYQPCRDFFAAEARQRQEHLQQRGVLLERLRNFEAAQSGERPDFAAIATVMREARQEWRRCSPVDRAAGATSQQEFDALLGRLHQRHEAWSAQGVAAKRALIERARAFAGQDDCREAAEGAKHLQQLWNESDTVERSLEQSLWREFREQCDLIFAKRQQARSDQLAALENRKAAAEAESRSAAALAHDQRQSFVRMLEASRLIQAYGCAVAQHAAASEREARKLAAEQFIAGVTLWPKGSAQAFKEAWQRADTALDVELPANERSLRLLCIRSEIDRDRPTPAEDQALRREHQMQRLTQRMGSRSEASAEDWESLALAWVRVGAVTPLVSQALLARFLACR